MNQATERRIPVFVYPPEITFHLKTDSSYKQLLTLYNPYDFSVKYKVFSNAREKYTVLEPSGTITARSYQDMVIRHNMPHASLVNITDKFMVTMQDAVSHQRLGKRYIAATLLPGERQASKDDSSEYSQCGDRATPELVETQGMSRNVMMYALMVVLMAALFVPTKEEPVGETWLPSMYHVSSTFKMVCAYILGLITTALLRLC